MADYKLQQILNCDSLISGQSQRCDKLESVPPFHKFNVSAVIAIADTTAISNRKTRAPK